ncbi:MAG: T9SS type A sorting domain-containing protein [Bacteroidota bacterium]
MVRTLELGALAAGQNEYVLNVEDLSPGVYFYTLEAGTFRATKRLIVQ